MNSLAKAISRAKDRVIASGKVNRYAYVCKDRDEIGRPTLEIMDYGTYQEIGDENKCVAAVWSYQDGHYDSSNVFHANGRIAAAVETY